MRNHVPKARTFNDVPTFDDAIEALARHQRWHHGPEVQQWLTRPVNLPSKVGTLVSNIYGNEFFLTDKGWVGISAHTFYEEPPYGYFTVLHEGTKDRQ